MKKLVTTLVMIIIAHTMYAQTEVAPPPPPMDAIDVPPPPPPPPPPIYKNKQGYNLEVYSNNGKGSVVVRKKGFEKTIALTEWKRNKKMYENKYGKLPPPPPAVEEEVIFTPPIIKRDN